MEATTRFAGERTAFRNLIRRARRRQWRGLALDALADAAAVVIGAIALLLATGLPRHAAVWAALAVAAALAFAGWRARRGIGAIERTARLLDARLGLSDTLATALYFGVSPVGGGSPAVVAHQRARAEQTAGSADVKRAFAFRRPASSGACVALLAVSSGLFVLRFATAKRLDLKAPLFRIGFADAPAPRASARARLQTRRPSRLPPSALTAPDEVPPAWQNNPDDPGKAPDDALSTVDEPNVDNAGATEHKAAKQEARTSADPATQADAKSERADASDDESGASEAKSGAREANPAPGQQSSPKGGERSGGQSSPSLMDRARDAMADLLNQFKPGARSSEGRQDGKSSQAAKQAQAQRQATNGASKANANSQQGAPDPNAEGDTASRAGQKIQSAQMGASKSSVKSDSPEAESGIGSEDGAKDARLADQLAAMGKISELIGKRSANVTGDMMVETGSSNQQLRTQYSSQKAAHTAAGGIVDRDEVPLAYQSYVQRYFEQIRKHAPAAQPKSTPAGALQ